MASPKPSKPPRRHRRTSAPFVPSWLKRLIAAVLIAVLAAGAAFLWQRRRAELAAAEVAAEAARPLVGAVAQTVYERGLVVRQTGAASVLREHGAFYFNVTRRVHRGLSLGFVSPWNSRGEQLAWRFASKLTHLSPILYGVDATGRVVTTEDESWLATLRQGLTCPACPPPARLVPLVSLADLDFARVFGAEDSEERAGRLLVSLLHTAAEHSLDGFVLDAHQHLAPLPRESRSRCAQALHLFVQVRSFLIPSDSF